MKRRRRSLGELRKLVILGDTAKYHVGGFWCAFQSSKSRVLIVLVQLCRAVSFSATAMASGVLLSFQYRMKLDSTN